MQYLWGMINMMQLIVNMPLLNVQFPQNAVIFYNFINSVANFNLIPTGWVSQMFASITNGSP